MLDTAIKAAQEAGKILTQYFETSLVRRYKDDSSIVTEADVKVEEKIIEVIKEKFPDHNFLGEESGEKKTGSAYTWVIDPIDGTTNFVNGIPIFAISIALLRDNKHVTSVVYNPITDTLFAAEKGKGVTCNGHAFSVSEQDAQTAMITLGRSQKAEDKMLVNKFFRYAQEYVKTVRYLGSAVLELAYVARGGTEGFINVGTKKWDYSAGTLLVLEAGGTITNFEGGEWDLDQNYFIASNGIIHPQLLELTKRVTEENDH